MSTDKPAAGADFSKIVVVFVTTCSSTSSAVDKLANLTAFYYI